MHRQGLGRDRQRGREFGVRGYISAYDAETGKMAWRTYTVPGDPAKGFESKAMEVPPRPGTANGGRPAEEAPHGKAWSTTRHSTCCTSEPAIPLRGTGRCGARQGDNLYTASILAVHASNGEIAWYFQTTPGDNWDFDATQPLMQADLTIGGRARKVIMQANKNGFFYVLDRETGEFISGTPFVDGITWAYGARSQDRRPIESPRLCGLKPVSFRPIPVARITGIRWRSIPRPDWSISRRKKAPRPLHAPDAEMEIRSRSRTMLAATRAYDGPLNAK